MRMILLYLKHSIPMNLNLTSQEAESIFSRWCSQSFSADSFCGGKTIEGSEYVFRWGDVIAIIHTPIAVQNPSVMGMQKPVQQFGGPVVSGPGPRNPFPIHNS